jgi:hypothetical protein
LEIQLTKRSFAYHYLVVIGDPINKKEVRIPLTVVIGDPINKKEARIQLTGCHWRSK